MAKPLHPWLTSGLALALIWGMPAWSQDKHTKVVHPAGAEFRQSLADLVFSPEGDLYAAYRLRDEDKTSSILRVIRIDTARGKITAMADYPVPRVQLPRVSTHFILNEDSTVLAYAELHAPHVLLTLDANTLKPLSSSQAALFAIRDRDVHIKDFKGQSLTLSAEQCRPRRPITVEAVRELALNPANLTEVLSDRKIPLDEDPIELETWMKMSKEDLSVVLPLERGALGFTNLKTRGSMRLLDSTGHTLDSAETHDCGVARAALSSDGEFAVAVCERTVRDNFRHEKNFSRKGLVLQVNSLRLMSSFPVSASTVVERGADSEEIWAASPSPTIWRGKDGLLVAVPDFSNTIRVYSVPLLPENAAKNKDLQRKQPD
ncbi:MAG TPA: hypothetical protein VJA94_14695 [Candidatus Angelobacter sp.]